MKKNYGFVALVFLLSLPFALPAYSSENRPVPPPQPATLSHRLLKSEPVVSLNPKGILNVQLETLRPCTGGQAYMGIVPDADEVGYPMFRSSGELVLLDSQRVSVFFNLRKLVSPKVDINRLREKSSAQITYRIILFADKERIFDRSVAYYRSADGEYHQASALVEGPFVDCVTQDGAVISWAFDRPTACELALEPGGISQVFSQPGSRYEIYVGNLDPDTRYTYRITWQASTGSPDIQLESRRYAFRTAPVPGDPSPFRFAVFSDCRATYGGGENSLEGVNARTLKPILTQLYLRETSFIAIAGDFVSGFTTDPAELRAQYRSFKRITAPVAARIPVYEGMGNHEEVVRFLSEDPDFNYISLPPDSSSEVLFAAEFVNPRNGPRRVSPVFPPYEETVYSFDWGNVHWVMLNNNYFEKGTGDLTKEHPGEWEGILRDEQLAWLDEDLGAARARGIEHLFVAAHEPAFPNGGHVKDAMWWNGEIPEIVEMRDRFWNILVKHRVLAAFFGHEHNYSRTLIDSTVNPEFTVPVWQIITGAGGAPFYARNERTPWADAVRAFFPLTHFCLVEVAGENVTLRALSPEGQTLDEVRLTDVR